jgi:hypothetical protein
VVAVARELSWVAAWMSPVALHRDWSSVVLREESLVGTHSCGLKLNGWTSQIRQKPRPLRLWCDV